MLGGGRREGVGVMKDKGLKLIEVEESHTLRRQFLFFPPSYFSRVHHFSFFFLQKYHSLASRVCLCDKLFLISFTFFDRRTTDCFIFLHRTSVCLSDCRDPTTVLLVARTAAFSSTCHSQHVSLQYLALHVCLL